MAIIRTFPNQIIVRSPGPAGPSGSGPGGGVTEVTGTAPISVATGTTTPVVSLDADGVTTGKIADEAVTNGKIADLTIQTGKIADGAITAAKLADTSVTSITGGSLIDVDQATGVVEVSHAPKGATGVATSYPGAITVDSFGHVVATGATSTPVIPSNNLSDLTNAATARTNLGLTIGTTAGDIVALDASAEVPLALLPALAAAYTGQIETIIEKTYTIDPGVVAGRTITSFYARSGAGACTATLYNAASVVGVVSVTTSSSNATISNTTVPVNNALTIVMTSNVAATDVVFSVEFTQ